MSVTTAYEWEGGPANDRAEPPAGWDARPSSSLALAVAFACAATVAVVVVVDVILMVTVGLPLS